MKLAVVGSRIYKDYNQLNRVLDELNEKRDIELIISGGADGTDTLASNWAKDKGIPTLIYYPKWQKHGKSAAFIRNNEIVKACTHLIAFWILKSRGTKLSIDLAKKMGKPVYIIEPIRYIKGKP